MTLLLLCFAYFSIYNCVVQSVRVCPTFPEYDWFLSSNCYNDPVLDQNITQIIQSWGFTAEEYYITTDDGYKILLERSYSNITQKTPIFIVHGIAMNSLGFVDRGRKSLAYVLGKLGYDVWLLNYRGTWYSKGHVNLTTKDPKYWSFSINELGIYDIRSAIKFVNEITKKKVIYIGYSMGTTGFFVYSATFPDEAKSYIKGMIALAPVINFKGTKSIIALTAQPVIWPVLKSFVYLLWQGEILPGFSALLKPLTIFSWGMYAIQAVANLICGDDYRQMDALRYPQFAIQMLDSAGAEVYTHYVQIYQSGIFRNYDYGPNVNLEVYGQRDPPTYNLSRVSIPVALYVGENDWLATPQNTDQLYYELPEPSRCGYHLIEFSKWSHIDFLIAKDIKKYLYQHVFRKITEIDDGNCKP